MRRISIVIVSLCLIALVLCPLFYYVITALSPELQRDFLSNLSANLVGVFVAVSIALYVDRIEKRRIENEQRRRISKSLISELEENLERIRSGDRITIIELVDIRRQALLTRFNTAVLESVINSGQMTLLESQTQTDLSNIHQILRLIEVTTNRILNFLTSSDRKLFKTSGGKKSIIWLMDNLEHQYEGLQDVIPPVLEDLRKKVE
jgi:hypothetical protein